MDEIILYRSEKRSPNPNSSNAKLSFSLTFCSDVCTLLGLIWSPNTGSVLPLGSEVRLDWIFVVKSQAQTFGSRRWRDWTQQGKQAAKCFTKWAACETASVWRGPEVNAEQMKMQSCCFIAVSVTVPFFTAENRRAWLFLWDSSALHFPPLFLKVNWLPVHVLFTSVFCTLCLPIVHNNSFWTRSLELAEFTAFIFVLGNRPWTHSFVFCELCVTSQSHRFQSDPQQSLVWYCSHRGSRIRTILQ